MGLSPMFPANEIANEIAVSGNLDVLNVQNFIARRLVIFPTLNFGQKSFSPPECCSYAYADHCAILWAQNNVEAFKYMLIIVIIIVYVNVGYLYPDPLYCCPLYFLWFLMKKKYKDI